MIRKTIFGRTMLEILTVLAIVGVISIGALNGFQLAMRHHEANQILNDVRLIAADVIQRETPPPVGDIPLNTDFHPSADHPYSAYQKFEDLFYVQVDEVNKGVCKLIFSKTEGSDYEIFLFDSSGASINGCVDQAQMQFYFGNDYSLCEITCEEGKVCAGGTCCEVDRVCGGRECCTSDQICCGGKCEVEKDVTQCSDELCCPTGQYCSPIENGWECICDSNDLPPCNGRCCDKGKVCSNGVCQGLACFEKDGVTPCTSDKCICKFGDKTCGTGCTQDGLSCHDGFCVNVCPAGTKFSYNSGMGLYGCLTQKASATGLTFNCTKSGGEKHCYLQDDTLSCGRYCDLDGSNCSYGACLNNPCTSLPNANLYTFELASSISGLYGCAKDGITCIYASCYLNGINCGTGCGTTPWRVDTCSVNSCLSSPCPKGFYAETISGSRLRCMKDDKSLYCEHTLGNKIHCYKKKSNGYERCGWECNLDGTGCLVGMCVGASCPAGSTEAHVAASFEADGCLTQFTSPAGSDYELTCVKNGTFYQCYRNGAACSARCSTVVAGGQECAPCHDTLVCPTGMHQTKYADAGGYRDACTDGLVTCMVSGKCFYNGLACGTGCQLDGSNCASGTICRCPESQEINYINNQYICRGRQDGICQNNTCSFGEFQCGTECTENNPSKCKTGVCDESICPAGTSLKRVTYQYYGCYSPTNGTNCYKEDTGFTCFKDGAQCGVGCAVDGTGCAKGQTCIEEEKESSD